LRWAKINEVILIAMDILIKQDLQRHEIVQEMTKIGVDPRGIAIMADKFQHYTVRLANLTFQQVIIIKQEMLARGAEAAVSWKACSGVNEREASNDLLLSGTKRQLEQFINKLAQQPFGLAKLGIELQNALYNYVKKLPSLIIQETKFDWSRTYLMGIINLTPDSFSQDGIYVQRETNEIDRALAQAEQMVAAGADFLDLGAESSRPGSKSITTEEEAKRLLPVLKELVKTVKIPLSVDTCKPEIAKQALELGATIVNDIWGLKSPDDPKQQMAQVVATAKAPVIIMHNQVGTTYKCLMSEIINSLAESIEIAIQVGVAPEQIIIDPGIGFGKTCQQNLEVLKNLDQLKILGVPILLGTSRKSVIGLTLDLPVSERLEGTIATSLWGIAKGANILRIHDLQAVARASRMYDAIKNS